MSKTANMNLDIIDAAESTMLDVVSSLNSNMRLIDEHTHKTGQGRLIPSSALNVDSDIFLNSQKLLNVNDISFTPRSSDAPENGSLYFKDNDLHVRDMLGRVIQITNNGVVVDGVISIDKTTSLLFGYGSIEIALNVDQAQAQTQAVNSFATPANRNAKTADFIKAGSYVEFTAPSVAGYYRIWVAFRTQDLQANTLFYNADNMDLDEQWSVAAQSTNVGAVPYRLFVRNVPLRQDQKYRLVVRSWK